MRGFRDEPFAGCHVAVCIQVKPSGNVGVVFNSGTEKTSCMCSAHEFGSSGWLGACADKGRPLSLIHVWIFSIRLQRMHVPGMMTSASAAGFGCRESLVFGLLSDYVEQSPSPPKGYT